MAGVVWEPRGDWLTESNVARFMAQHRIGSIGELIERSRDDIAWFWSAAEKWLGIDWAQPYSQVVDTSAGTPWAKWFTGGKVNLARNCVDRHATGDRRDKAAFIWEGEDGEVRRWTFAELGGEVARFANVLRKLGIGPGDTVGLYVPLVPEAAAAAMACAKIGAIFIPIFSGYGPGAVADRLRDAGARVLITLDAFLRRGKWVEMKPVADEAAVSSGTVRHTVVIRRRGGEVPWTPGRDHWWHEIREDVPADCDSLPLDPETPFMVIYTSGTTGKPKGAVHVHGGFLVKIAEEVAFQTDLRESDTFFWFTDLGWIMGPWELVGAWARGGTVFACEGAPDHPKPDRLWAMIERHRVSILGISPTAIRALMKYGDEPVTSHDLSSLRLLGSTGEPWNPDPWMWYFERVGGGRCPIINLSGGTEVGACFLSPHPVQPLTPCTLGGPALGMDIDVFDDQGRPVRGKVGELVCRKPWPGMTRGVWKDPDRFIETYWSRWPGVWVHGDWASIDDRGFWYLHGRSDDTIKIAGKRVGPAEVESVVTGHRAVVESAAIGVPDEVKGESLVVFAVLRPGFEPTDALKSEIVAHVVADQGKTMKPEALHFVRGLPRTRSAKILRRMIRAAYIGEPVGDTTNLENPDAVEEIVEIRRRLS